MPRRTSMTWVEKWWKLQRSDGLMNDDAAFLRAIRENPDDPIHCLVYADWLEERGDPRGEYLRLGCRLAELRDRIDPVWLASVREVRYQTQEIHLNSGRLVFLCELRQFLVYEGLLLGFPTTEKNQREIEGILARERERSYPGQPYLIQPEEKPIPYTRKEPYPL